MIEAPVTPVETRRVTADFENRKTSTGKRIQTVKNSSNGKCIGAERVNHSGKPHLLQSVIAQANSGGGFDDGISDENFRWQVYRKRSGTNIVILVDSSGSMLAKKKIETAKGCAMSLLKDAYVCRDTVSLIAFGGQEAKLVLPPTNSPELAAQLLKSIRTGGKTPLIDALAKAELLLEQGGEMPTLFILITDGKYTRSGIADPEEEIQRFGEECQRRRAKILVVDAEKKSIFSLGTAGKLAERLGGTCIPMDELCVSSVREASEGIIKI